MNEPDENNDIFEFLHAEDESYLSNKVMFRIMLCILVALAIVYRCLEVAGMP